MKIRNIPYGYAYEDGKIVIHPQESAIVKEIFQQYLCGESLLSIANSLNKRKIEYTAGIVGWNKGRLKRIIEDERYLGNTSYLSIINKKTYQALQKIKDDKNTQKNIDRNSGVFQIRIPVRCPKCHSAMHRRCDNTYTHKERWKCSNKTCRTLIVKRDEDLLEEITVLLNQLIDSPETIQEAIEKKVEESDELRKVNAEITRMFNSVKIQKEELLQDLLKQTSLSYNELDSEVCMVQKLRDIFVANPILETFSVELFDKTVKEIVFEKDKTVGLVLKNNQKIRRNRNGCSSYAKDSVGEKDTAYDNDQQCTTLKENDSPASRSCLLPSLYPTRRTTEQL